MDEGEEQTTWTAAMCRLLFFLAPLGYGGRYILSLGVRRGGRGWRSDILEGGRGEGIGCLSEPMMVEGGRGWRRTLLEGGKQAWQANEYIRGRLLSLLDCLLALRACEDTRYPS